MLKRLDFSKVDLGAKDIILQCMAEHDVTTEPPPAEPPPPPLRSYGAPQFRNVAVEPLSSSEEEEDDELPSHAGTAMLGQDTQRQDSMHMPADSQAMVQDERYQEQDEMEAGGKVGWKTAAAAGKPGWIQTAPAVSSSFQQLNPRAEPPKQPDGYSEGEGDQGYFRSSNKGWTKEEFARVEQLVQVHGTTTAAFEIIAGELGTGRSAPALAVKWRTEQKNAKKNAPKALGGETLMSSSQEQEEANLTPVDNICCDGCQSWFTSKELEDAGMSFDDAKKAGEWKCGVCLGIFVLTSAEPTKKQPKLIKPQQTKPIKPQQTKRKEWTEEEFARVKQLVQAHGGTILADFELIASELGTGRSAGAVAAKWRYEQKNDKKTAPKTLLTSPLQSSNNPHAEGAPACLLPQVTPSCPVCRRGRGVCRRRNEPGHLDEADNFVALSEEQLKKDTGWKRELQNMAGNCRVCRRPGGFCRQRGEPGHLPELADVEPSKTALQDCADFAWSDDEFEQLKAMVAKDGTGAWERKAKALGTGRTAAAVQAKWMSGASSSAKAEPWSSDDIEQ